ncbi:type II pantothenate kinase [Niallia taxi]|uniref:type II pantothenate kinase n=1 Tax=Niallia taxi TaxID=2499688 RepID=UPI0039829F2A
MAKIGIDAGGSMIKLAFEQNGRIHFRKYPNAQTDTALKWLKLFEWNDTAITGSKAAYLKQAFFPDASILPEFDAVCTGARWLKDREYPHVNDEFLLVNIGTGTSWFKVSKKGHSRVLGSGIGGGTIMGLAQLLTGVQDFAKITELASKGSKNKIDVLVKDLYEEDIGINGSLTASNFGYGNTLDGSKEDKLSSLFQMTAETIVLMSQQAGTIHQIDQIIYAGGAVSVNMPLQKSISSFDYLFPKSQLFLQDGQFCGACGALLSV